MRNVRMGPGHHLIRKNVGILSSRFSSKPDPGVIMQQVVANQ